MIHYSYYTNITGPISLFQDWWSKHIWRIAQYNEDTNSQITIFQKLSKLDVFRENSLEHWLFVQLGSRIHKVSSKTETCSELTKRQKKVLVLTVEFFLISKKKYLSEEYLISGTKFTIAVINCIMNTNLINNLFFKKNCWISLLIFSRHFFLPSVQFPTIFKIFYETLEKIQTQM